jgi:hypothetical protein
MDSWYVLPSDQIDDAAEHNYPCDTEDAHLEVGEAEEREIREGKDKINHDRTP